MPTKQTLAILFALAMLTPHIAAQNQPPQRDQGGGGERRGQGQGGGGDRIYRALDPNQDESISSDELANAPAALLTLDRNNDGILTPDEIGGGRRGGGGGGDGGRGGDVSRDRQILNAGGNPEFMTQVPPHPYDIILGRPTTTTIDISVLSYQGMRSHISYGSTPNNLSHQTESYDFIKDEPHVIKLTNLKPNTRYYYQLNNANSSSKTNTFHTPRAPGQPFTFTIQADSHLDSATDPRVYEETLRNTVADQPDFHVALGDTFMNDKYRNYKDSLEQYIAQRYYFGLIGQSAPLYWVIGNHDGEAARWLNGTSDNMGVWSNLTRKKYIPNPRPNDFYTGNDQPMEHMGLLENYYAFQWGDALMITLDPFWHTTSRNRGGGSDFWGRTLGDQQYAWLKQTLEESNAKWKFVFIHHLVGGADRSNRGGAEASRYFEWGGQSLDGQNDFASRRPNWKKPIHDLLVDHQVTAVFHGHDHLYVQQQRDNIIYQEVPQPGHPRGGTRSAEEYGYQSGVILGSSGHLRINVSPENIRVDYVQSNTRDQATVAHSYIIER